MKRLALTRRDFLKGTAGLVAATALGPGLPSKGGAEDTAKVVLVRNQDVLGAGGEVRAPVLQSMLDEGVKKLLGKEEQPESMAGLVQEVGRGGHKEQLVAQPAYAA